MKLSRRWLIFLFIFLFLGSSCLWAQQSLSEAEITQKVDSVMQNMSLTDKVGEMTQLTIDMISKSGQGDHQLDEEKLKNILLNYRVGSILNVSGHAYTLDHWHKVIQKIQEIAVHKKPTGISILYGIDSIHGANYVMGSTLFPQQIALAATWNTDLVKKGAGITACETRAA